MNWLQKIAQIKDYPLAGSVVSGLTVLEDIDNMSSIGATFMWYEIMDGIREILMSEFGSSVPSASFYAWTDFDRCRALAEEIRTSGEIMPLIVAIDRSGKGPWMVEGGHRFVALGLLGVQSLPALVVIDED